MSSGTAYVAPDAARERVTAELDAIDAALGRLRQTATSLVGNAFRVEMADRLEAQQRVNRGLSYRMFGEMFDPPDGVDDPELPAGARVRDVLCERLRILPAEVRRRAKLAVRIRPRRSLTGAELAPELPVLAEAVESGDVGDDHIREICKAIDVLPNAVPAAGKNMAEKVLVRHARKQDSAFVAEIGRRIADTLNPDGIFDDRDRAARRGLVLGRQGPDGMSRLSGWLTPEARSYVEAVGAAVRPGRHVPGADAPVVGAHVDDRSSAQRLHDAVALGLKAGIESGALGSHRGIPVTVIATTTLDALEQAAKAVVDPTVPMPPPARTGGGSSLPMRDLIRMASNGIHYLVVFDEHSARPLYLGRSKRIATPDQRIVCYARDNGCTHPDCLAPGYQCEVHHAPDWDDDGRTDADKLFFACGPHHGLASGGTYSTVVTGDGRLAWSGGTGPPRVNRVHHDDELLGESEPEAEPDERDAGPHDQVGSGTRQPLP